MTSDCQKSLIWMMLRWYYHFVLKALICYLSFSFIYLQFPSFSIVFPSKTTGGILKTSEQEIFCINVSAKTATCSFYLRRVFNLKANKAKLLGYFEEFNTWSTSELCWNKLMPKRRTLSVLRVLTLSRLDGGGCVLAIEAHLRPSKTSRLQAI